MNIILLEPEEQEDILSLLDPRIIHIKRILGRELGEEFDAGLVNGPRGKGWIREETEAGILLGFRPTGYPPPLAPLILAVGASRPQTARKILLQATTLGVEEIHFFASERGEKGYLKSRLYQSEAMRSCLVEGARQAFCTRLPQAEVHGSLSQCLDRLSKGSAVGLDNYEATALLYEHSFPDAEDTGEGLPLTLWVGSERGWSDTERKTLRRRAIPLRSLGRRVLRIETAVVAGISLCLAGMEEAMAPRHSPRKPFST